MSVDAYYLSDLIWPWLVATNFDGCCWLQSSVIVSITDTTVNNDFD